MKIEQSVELLEQLPTRTDEEEGPIESSRTHLRTPQSLDQRVNMARRSVNSNPLRPTLHERLVAGSNGLGEDVVEDLKEEDEGRRVSSNGRAK